MTQIMPNYWMLTLMLFILIFKLSIISNYFLINYKIKIKLKLQKIYW